MSARLDDLFYAGEAGSVRSVLAHVALMHTMGKSADEIAAHVARERAESDARVAAHDAAVDAAFRERIASLGRA